MQKCFNCLEETEVSRYYIANRGYGSYFDGLKTHLDLCDKCRTLIKEGWFYEFPVKEDYLEIYQHEDELLQFIENMPNEGQWYFWVKYNKSLSGYHSVPGWIEWSDDNGSDIDRTR